MICMANVLFTLLFLVTQVLETDVSVLLKRMKTPKS